MYEHNRCKQYSCLRNMITKNEINSCLHLINRVKEHRHDKNKVRLVVKFKHLYFEKKHGYHHNFTRGSENFKNIANGSNTSGNSSTPATLMAPGPSVITPLAPTAPSVAPSNNPIGTRHTCINSDNIKQKWVINLSNTPSHQHKNHYWQEAKLCYSSQVLPQGILHYSSGGSLFQTPPGKQMNWDLTSITYLGTLTTITKPTSLYRNAGH